MLFLFSVWASAMLQNEKSLYSIAMKVQKGTYPHKIGKKWKNIVHRQALINSLFSKRMETTSSYAQGSLHRMMRNNPLTIPSPTVVRAQTLRRERCLIVFPIWHILQLWRGRLNSWTETFTIPSKVFTISYNSWQACYPFIHPNFCLQWISVPVSSTV